MTKLNKKSIIKTTLLTSALLLGIGTAVETMTAEAATTYTLKSGKLVVKSSGKTASGYITYNKKLYYNGTLFTGIKSSKYYKSGVLATGIYKDKYYKKGVLATGTYKSKYYSKGVLFTGLKSSKYYKNGVLATGTYKDKFYYKGALFSGVYKDKYYKKGVLTTAVFKNKYYKNGVLATGFYKDKYYKNGVVYTGYHVSSGKLYKGAKIATGTVNYEENYYINGELAELVTFEGDDAYDETVTLKDSTGKVVKKYDYDNYLLVSGTYTFTVVADGYAKYTKTIDVNAENHEESFTFSLSKSSKGNTKEDDSEDDSDSEDTPDSEDVEENDDGSDFDSDSDDGVIFDDDDDDSESPDVDEDEGDDEDAITEIEFEADDAYGEKIVVKDSDGTIVKAASSGYYKLSPGTYTYTITASGYSTVKGEFTVDGGGSDFINFTMDRK